MRVLLMLGFLLLATPSFANTPADVCHRQATYVTIALMSLESLDKRMPAHNTTVQTYRIMIEYIVDLVASYQRNCPKNEANGPAIYKRAAKLRKAFRERSEQAIK